MQVCGLAMGKKYSPGLANLYLLDLDNQAMNGYKIKPILFFRFLDDIFFLWPSGIEELKEYEKFLNSIIPGIKLTLNHDKNKIHFLDTTIYKCSIEEVTCLKTKVYFKETDTHQLLHTGSFHASHTARGVLYSQLKRFKRISSSRLDYNEACNILFKSLINRGYSRTLMRKAQKEVWTNSSKSPIREKTKNDPIFPIVLPFNSVGEKLALGYKQILQRNPLFKKYKIVTAFTNSKNMANYLVKSRIDNKLNTA